MAHSVRSGFASARQVARTAFTLLVAFACAGGTTSTTHSPALLADFTVDLSSFSATSPWVDDDGVDSRALHPSEIRGAGKRLRARAEFDTPEARLLGAGATSVDARLRGRRPECDGKDGTERAEGTETPRTYAGPGVAHAECGAAALRCERRPFAAVGAAPTMTPYESAAGVACNPSCEYA